LTNEVKKQGAQGAKALKVVRIAAKILAWTIGGVLGFVVVLLISLNFLLNSASFTGFVLDKVLPGVEESLGAKIGVEKLTLSFVPFRLRLGGVVFTNATGDFKRDFATLDKLELDVNFGALLGGEVVVERLLIDGVTNYLYLDPDGLANFPIASSDDTEEEEAPSEGPPVIKLPILIKDVQIKNVAIYVDMDSDLETPGLDMEASILSINLSANGDLSSGDTHAELRVADGHFKYGELEDTLEKIDIDVDFSLIRWAGKVTKLEIRLPDVELDATAEATDVLGDMRIIADLDGRINLEKVNKLFLPDPILCGELKLAVHADAPLPNYSARGELTMPEACVNDLALRDFKLNFDATQDEVKLSELFVRVADGSLRVQADLGMAEAMPLSARVKLAGLNVKKALDDFGMRGLGVAATLGGDISVTGRLGNADTQMALATKVDLALVNVAYSDIVRIPVVTVDVKSDYRPSGLALHHALITTKNTKIAADGSITLPKVGLNLNYLVDAADLSEFSPVMEKEVAGSIRLEGIAKGLASALNVDASLAIDKVKFGDMGVDEVRGHVSMAGKKLTVDKFFVRNNEALIELAATANLAPKTPEIDAELKIPTTDIKNFLTAAGMADLEVAGNIGLDVKVNGPTNKLTGNADILLADIKAYGEKLTSLHLGAALNEGAVQINDLSLIKAAPPRPDYTKRADKVHELPIDEWNEAVIRATGSFDPESGRLALNLNSEGLNEQASDILRQKNLPLIADISLDIQAEGTVKEPKARVELNIAGGRFGEMVLGDSNIKVLLADGRAHVLGSLLANRENISVETPIPTTEKSWRIRRFDSTAGDEKQQNIVEAVKENMPKMPRIPLLNAPEDFTQETAAATTSEEVKKLGSIDLDITADLQNEQRLDGKVVFNRFDYSGFLGSLKKKELATKKKDGEDAEDSDEKKDIVEGLLDGKITLGGSLAKPDEIAADVEFGEIYFRKNELVIRNEDKNGQARPVRLSYRNQKIDVESFMLGGKLIDIRLEKQNEMFVLVLRADMGVAQEFADILTDAKGTLSVDASIPDSFDPNLARAALKIVDGNFSVRGVPTPLTNLNVVANYEDGAVSLDRMDAKIGGGKLSGGGKITMPKDEDDIMRMKLRMNVAGVRTGMDPHLEVAIDKVDIYISTIEKGKNRGKLDISGEVVLDKAVFSQNVDFLTLFSQFTKLGDQKSATGQDTYEEKEESVFFNIAIRAADDVGVSSNLAEIETRMDLLLVGNNVSPGLKGSVEVIKGWAMVLQNTYKLSRVTIQFYDEQRIFPSFDINADTQIKGTSVFVSLAGNPLKYNMTLTSDPPKPQRDIFFLLATGASYEEFQSQGSGISSDEAAGMAAQQLVGGSLGKLSSAVGGNLEMGIDSSSGTSRIKIKSEVEKDMYMSIYRGLVDQSLGSEIEYDFYRYVAATGSWSNMAGYDDAETIGAFGTGLRLKIDFQ
jgi:TamB, inner membrane protein subunit of TAM complex/AsmA family